jgi:probable F420-dependent oxidoreductase
LKFVVSMAFSDPAHLGELARAADEAGFAYASLSDHLVHPRQLETPYPYTEDGTPRWEPFTSWPDPWVTVGSLSARTSRLNFYTSVYVLPMRDPFSAAKTIGTAAVLSQGRVALGVGAGWMKDEFELVGRDFHTRGRRMNEMIEVLRKLWQGGWVEHHGEFYDFDPLEMSPVPTARIPIFVGGFSEPALRRAATLGDGWISDLHDSAELQKLITRIRDYRADSEQADRPFEIFGSVMDAAGLDGYRRMQDMGVTHTVTFPWVFYSGFTEDLQEKLDGIARFGDEIISVLD